jgi:hypothetical protein
MTPFFKATSLGLALVLLSGCRTEQRESIDSAAGVAESSARAAISVINVRLGHGVDAERKITNEDETFVPSDTIYASVHTSGRAKEGSSVVGRWTFPDGSIVNQNANEAAAIEYRLVFFIAKPGGLPAGPYTFQILVDGREARSKAALVRRN